MTVESKVQTKPPERYLPLRDAIFERDGTLFERSTGLPARTTLTPKGYLRVSHRSDTFFVHRVIWFLNYGCLPEGQIDHINDDKTDNRISNLRDVSAHENNPHNKVRPTVVHGIRYKADERRWCAEIIGTYLGRFETRAEAVAARLAAERICERFGLMTRPRALKAEPEPRSSGGARPTLARADL